MVRGQVRTLLERPVIGERAWKKLQSFDAIVVRFDDATMQKAVLIEPYTDQNRCIWYSRYSLGAKTRSKISISQIDVYWTLSAQLIEKTRDLPRGTRVGSVRINSTDKERKS
jgi:hypothetical protein